MLVSVEGNIGVGKTSFLELVKTQIKEPNLEVIQEPTAEPELIRNYYSDPESTAFYFQVRMLINRANALFTAIKSGKKNVLMERTLFVDRYVFFELIDDLGLITPYERNAYLELFENISLFLAEPDYYIYFYAPPDILLERIKKRDRQGETKNISICYLKALEEKYNKFLKNKKTFKVFIYDIKKQYRIIWNNFKEFVYSVK